MNIRDVAHEQTALKQRHGTYASLVWYARAVVAAWQGPEGLDDPDGCGACLLQGLEDAVRVLEVDVLPRLKSRDS